MMLIKRESVPIVKKRRKFTLPTEKIYYFDKHFLQSVKIFLSQHKYLENFKLLYT